MQKNSLSSISASIPRNAAAPPKDFLIPSSLSIIEIPAMLALEGYLHEMRSRTIRYGRAYFIRTESRRTTREEILLFPTDLPTASGTRGSPG
jgi:hypothetical protein